MTDEWWRGKALDQDTHRAINAQNYPGTRQLCEKCDEPTGRCEDDEIYYDDYVPLCETCFDELREDEEEGHAAALVDADE